MDSLSKIKELVKDIDPGTSILDIEGKYLYKLARKNSIGPVVEIGSWKGRSTIWLAQACIDKLKEEDMSYMVYAVDPHIGTSTHEYEKEGDTYQAFIDNMKKAGVDEIIVPIRMRSKEALKEVLWERKVGIEGLGLIFIDGNHDYEEVKFDFYNWVQALSIGGIIVLHDTIGYEGPRRVIKENVLNPQLKIIGVVGQLVAFRKCEWNDLVPIWNLMMVSYWIKYGLLFRLAKKLPKGVKEILKGV